MRTMETYDGQAIQMPETEQEWLDMQPEARLRELFDGDIPATLAFHDRLRDLERRFYRWQAERYWRARKRVAWIESVEVRQ